MINRLGSPTSASSMEANTAWWDKSDGNVTEVIYTPIKSDPTRVAALLSGDVDLLTDLPTQDVARLRQDPKLKIARRPRGAHHLHRAGPVQPRAEVLRRQGQEPVQGQARARGAEPWRSTARRSSASPCAACRSRRHHGGARASTATSPDIDVPAKVDAEAREEAARRGRLPERLRVPARLPEQPLRQRRGDLPGAGGHVGADRREGQAGGRVDGHLHPEDAELRHLGLHAGLGRGHLRRAVHAAVADPHRDHRRRRQLQPRPHQRSEAGRADRRDEDRDRRGQAQRADPRSAGADARRGATTSRCTTSCGPGR